MERTRINNNGTMDQMGKNRNMPGYYIEHYVFDGEHWKREHIVYFATEYEAELHFKSVKA